MLQKILNYFGYIKKPETEIEPEIKNFPLQFDTDYIDDIDDITKKLDEAWAYNFQKINHIMTKDHIVGAAMDNQVNIKAQWQGNLAVSQLQSLYYASNTFIGYQMCALISQNWLVTKACIMPAKDATRHGYEITVNDGKEVDPCVLDEIRKLDIQYQINQNCVEFVYQGRVFGIRVALFIVESDDPDYYRNPFNLDGVTEGSYKGISQIDPYWITPQLDTESSGNPASMHFLTPTWWTINGKLVHRTHLRIFITEQVPDILKPTYIYGGIPITQKIFNRVYAAEKTANEAPILAMTKRTDVINTDVTQAVSNPSSFISRLKNFTTMRDNYGVKILGEKETMNRFDTSLTDLDAVIMTQYQLVAAASNVPATKLMGTSPKGFNATGEFEESSYHEELESIQAHDLTPLIEHHHQLLIKSEICPKFGIDFFETSIVWNSVDAMTAKEKAEVNKLEADTGLVLIQSGAIDSIDERERIVNNPQSGYNGLILHSEDEDENELLGSILNSPEGS